MASNWTRKSKKLNKTAYCSATKRHIKMYNIIKYLGRIRNMGLNTTITYPDGTKKEYNYEN